MINLERDQRWEKYQQTRGYGERFTKSIVVARERASSSFQAARERAEQLLERLVERKPKFSYVFPERGRLKSYFQYEEVFTHLPNPFRLDLPTRFQAHFRKKERGMVSKDSPDIDNDILLESMHARDVARAAVASENQQCVYITGFEAVVSEIMKRAGTAEKKGAFTHLEFADIKLPLARQDGSAELVHKIFDRLPKPLPEGSSLRFVSKDRALEVTVLPVPKESVEKIRLAYLCLLGSQHIADGSLSEVLNDARKNRKRVVVVYKEGDEGIVHSFVQPHPGTENVGPTDIYEILPDKDRVVRVNGRSAKNFAIPVLSKKSPGQENHQAMQVIVVPVDGSIEYYIAGKKPLPSVITRDNTEIAAVVGIDAVEKGETMMREGVDVMPLDFRGRMAKFFRPAHIRELYRRDDKGKFYQYVRLASIIPIHLVAVRPEKIKVRSRTVFTRRATPKV